MRTVDQYVLRVLGDQWTAPSRTPTLLDVSRRGDATTAGLAVAFRVTRVAQEDSSLETLGERLAAIHRHFDAVVVRDVLDTEADWRDVVSRAARRVRPGGVFVYGVSTGAGQRWLDRLLPRGLRRARPLVPAGEMAALLRRSGLLQREMISLAAETLDATTTTYMGHSIMKGLPHTATTLQRDFTGTGERWMATARS